MKEYWLDYGRFRDDVNLCMLQRDEDETHLLAYSNVSASYRIVDYIYGVYNNAGQFYSVGYFIDPQYHNNVKPSKQSYYDKELI